MEVTPSKARVASTSHRTQGTEQTLMEYWNRVGFPEIPFPKEHPLQATSHWTLTTRTNLPDKIYTQSLVNDYLQKPKFRNYTYVHIEQERAQLRIVLSSDHLLFHIYLRLEANPNHNPKKLLEGYFLQFADVSQKIEHAKSEGHLSHDTHYIIEVGGSTAPNRWAIIKDFETRTKHTDPNHPSDQQAETAATHSTGSEINWHTERPIIARAIESIPTRS